MNNCSNCNKPVEQENESLCNSCIEDMMIEELQRQQEESRWVEISREMALDAGDPSLEGQLIKW